MCSVCDDYALDSALLDEYLLAASEVLYELSGKQFSGECEETIRPCTTRTLFQYPYNTNPLMYRSGFWPGSWPFYSACGCTSDDACSCTTLHQIKLPRYPILEITEVKVDGVILPTSAYRVDEYQFLVRLDGESWPCCQDLSLPDTAEDTFSVEYTYGRSVPALGRRAAAILACELYMACQPETDDLPCRLPRTAVQIARQGVSVLIANAAELFRTRPNQPAQTGIWEIDLFLRSFNPFGLTAPSVILSADEPRLARRVDT